MISRVAVVGAGASGLAALRCLQEVGIEVVAFESTRQAGGIWNYTEDLPDGGGIAYRSLRTNTSSRMMAFSDTPFPGEAGDFPARQDVLQYLIHYAEKFDLRPHIRVGVGVHRLSTDESGSWNVDWESLDGRSGTDSFDAVVVCTGFYHEPITPQVDGIGRFSGRILHSRDYKGPEGFEEKRVVVVGAGSSGADIAAEVGAVASSTDLSSKSGMWFLPHYIGIHPYDFQITRLSNALPLPVQERIFRYLVTRAYKQAGFNKVSIQEKLDLPAFDLWRARLTPGSHILDQILTGNVRLRPQIRAINEETVTFIDGSTAQADIVVFCTGYSLNLPFLEPKYARVQGDVIDLYRLVFSPGFPTLAFVGMCIVAGPIFPVAEMQSRWIAQVFAGNMNLPSPIEMQQEVDRHLRQRSEFGVHPMRIQLAEYMDETARLIGVKPRLLRHPSRLAELIAGPQVAAQYRLDGPGSI